VSADQSASFEPLNPYSAPETEVERATRAIALVKATRLQRLSAFVFDASLGAVPFVPLMLSDERSVLFCLFVCMVLSFIVLCVQLLLLSQNGWTVGKRALRIKIVHSNGERAGAGRILVVRAFVPAVLSLLAILCLATLLDSLALSTARRLGWWIPSVALLIDPLLIFGRARRCGHDYIADTIVVKA
jgi:uncharacterized RDD family membrane protein YckC